MLVLSVSAAPAAAATSSIGDPQDGCSPDPPLVACPSGQTSYYVAQTSLKCAHYICSTRPPGGGGGGDDDGSDTSSKKSVVLPAVLGSVLSAIAIGFGILYYIIRRNRTGRAVDAQHQDAKYMSGYNNLGDDSFGTSPRSPGAYSSTYSVSKWRDSAFQTPGSPHAHTSVPVIFSQENSAEFMHGSRETKLYNGAHEPVFRETRLYPVTAPTDDARQWAAPNVVNVKQKPQLVVLDNSISSSVSGGGLEVNTANIRASRSTNGDIGSDTDSDTDSDSVSNFDPNSPATPLTPDTPDVSNISQASTLMTTQMPRIVQVGRPLMIRALESSQKLEPPSFSSPLRVESNGWDSDSGDEEGKEAEEEAEDARDVESDIESEVESDVEDRAAPNVERDAEPDADVESEYESEYSSEYDSEYESDAETEDDNDNDNETNPLTPNQPTITEPRLVPLEEQPPLGPELTFETAGDDSFFADVLKATANIDVAHTNPKP
ncbi:hypothetical protein IW146_001140 [Coemansia sp. RSA 922]|nr:hypothetical protein GGI08_005670 [Coemansia sp. S2]KAJ2116944.1 hypothetical protein IW146_001140 [Coemansia sp. RSA 922]